MKPIAFLFLLAISSPAFAQDIRPMEFKSKEDYKKQEKEVLACARYVMNNPENDNDKARLVSMQNIIKWMSGTPDYMFDLDASISKLSKKNEGILPVFMAAMTQFVLENPSKAKDKGEVKYQSFALLLDYCDKDANNMKKTKEVQKAIQAKKDNTLKQYLGL